MFLSITVNLKAQHKPTGSAALTRLVQMVNTTTLIPNIEKGAAFPSEK
jgi:hypothetical protein